MTLGTMFVDEEPFDLVAISLRDGRVWFRGRTETLRRRREAGPTTVRVHAPDGSLIIATIVDLRWPRRGADVWHVELPVRIEGSRPGEEWPVAESRGGR